MSTMIRLFLSTLLLGVIWSSPLQAQLVENEKGILCANGFELTDLTIPADLVFTGGPGKDGIPALKKPVFLSGDTEADLSDDEYVIGVQFNGEIKAYPVAVLNYHEVINDRFGEEETPVVITYSPLCASATAFRAELDDKRQEFAVSGLVYNNNLLFYDRKTESIWSQLKGQAVSGPQTGRQLEVIPTEMTTWADWSTRHPETKVLSRQTGFDRNYNIDPYYSVTTSDRLMFPVGASNEVMPLREKVIAIERNGIFKAYPFSVLNHEPKPVITDELLGEFIQVHFNKEAQSARITNLDGQELAAVTTYWFSWFAFYPDTELYFYGDGLQPPLPRPNSVQTSMIFGGERR